MVWWFGSPDILNPDWVFFADTRPVLNDLPLSNAAEADLL